MSISSSIYIGASGVIAHQENMSVISDNIANINTVGFKSSRMLFNNLLSQELTGASVNNQIGRGVGLSSTLLNMREGPWETTNTATDMAIGGHGFFTVAPENSETMYYTRSGNFRFDEQGYLRDPRGNILQGHKLPPTSLLTGNNNLGSTSQINLQDIQLNINDQGMSVSDPEATTEIRMMVNLDSGSEDKSGHVHQPLTALFDTWNAQNEEPLAHGDYAYASSMKIYDDQGHAHALTTYFDPVTQMQDAPSGYRTWEFLVTIPPQEHGAALESKKGILMAGTLTFAPSGELVNMSAFQGQADDQQAWVPVELNSQGFPIFEIDFVDAQTMTTALDLGINTTLGWQIPAGTTSLADLNNSFANLPKMHNPEKQVMAVTNFRSGSSTIYQSQNGYTRGYLESVSVTPEAILVGNYSNGQNQALFKIPLADFINPQELFREGGNLFTVTKKSGPSSWGWAGEGRLGRLAGSTLENSNVDLATEFVDMIITQKGFDANSKAITTGDQVIQTAIQMKR